MKFNFSERLYLLYRVGLCVLISGAMIYTLADKDFGLFVGYTGLTMLGVAFFVGVKEFVKTEVISIKDLRTKLAVDTLEITIKEGEAKVNGIVVEELVKNGKACEMLKGKENSSCAKALHKLIEKKNNKGGQQ